jgi:hypothetical protein
MNETDLSQPLFDRTEIKQRVTQTYSGPSNWDRVQEYEKAMRWHTAHPKRGSQAASTALELPRGRLRRWFDGGKPDAGHAIDTAESHGWIDSTPGEPTFEGLSVLHAWVLAGGAISKETYTPSLAIGASDPADLAHEAFRAVGISSQSVNDASTDRTQELRPKGPGQTHLGRFLYGVLGAPVGEKTTVGSEPLQFLDSVPQTTLLRWCQTYVSLRGTSIELARGERMVRLSEKRTRRYQEALADLFRSAVGGDAQITVTQRATLLRGEALTMLDQVPTLPDSR